jgi:hypothetical protein
MLDPEYWMLDDGWIEFIVFVEFKGKGWKATKPKGLKAERIFFLMLDTGYRMLAVGRLMLDTGFWMLDFGFRCQMGLKG